MAFGACDVPPVDIPADGAVKNETSFRTSDSIPIQSQWMFSVLVGMAILSIPVV